MTLRQSVHHLLEGDPHTATERFVRAALALLIVLNVGAVVLETVPWLHAEAPGAFAAFETFSIVVFSLEYLLRLWSAVEDVRFVSPVRGRLRWIFTPTALVDLLAVLPAFVPSSAFDLRTLRLLRLLRIVRVAKLGRYSIAVQTLQNVLRNKAADLLSLLSLLMVLLIVSSTLMYFVEHETQPATFSSIPATMWWGIVTLTTVGYGDMAPVTTLGRSLGGITAILGIGMFALPAGLLGAAFLEELNRVRESRRHQHTIGSEGHGPMCPHCGKRLT